MTAFEMVRGRSVRFTRLDANGAPSIEDAIVSEGIARVTVGEVSESVSDELLRNEEGVGRVLFRNTDRTRHYTTDISLLGVDPRLIELLTGNPLVTNAWDDVVGNDMVTHLKPTHFAMEVWTKLARPVSGNNYGWTLFPRITGGRIGGLTISNAAANFTITGARTRRSSQWGLGPHAGGGWGSAPWNTTRWEEPRTPFVGSRVHWRTTLTNFLPQAQTTWGEQSDGAWDTGSWNAGYWDLAHALPDERVECAPEAQIIQ